MAVTTASPLRVMCQSMTPGPGLWLGVAPGAWVSLILVPLGNGPNVAVLPVSAMVTVGFGSTASEAVRT